MFLVVFMIDHPHDPADWLTLPVSQVEYGAGMVECLVLFGLKKAHSSI